MEHIKKNNSIETAKNRLYISGLTYVDNTQYVYDRLVNNDVDAVFKQYIPLVKTDDGYILRYKNLVRQYYWLINEFIPSCKYQKLCYRNGGKVWINYENASDVFRTEFLFNFYDDNEILISSFTILRGDNAKPFTPEKTGYDFNGWYTEPGGSILFDFDGTQITGDTNVYASYSIKHFRITFKPNNGDEDIVIDATYGSIPSTEEPSKVGYTFNGWYPEIVPVTSNAVYNATYNINMYVVRFFDIIKPDDVLSSDMQPIHTGGEVDRSKYKIIKTETIAYGETSEYYQIMPTYNNFICNDNWIDSNGNPINDIRFIIVTDDIDAYPMLNRKNYTVTFMDWDNQLIPTDEYFRENPQTVMYMDDADAPHEEPTREHYTFIGWDVAYTSITHDTTIHAKYIGEDTLYEYLLPDVTLGEYILFNSGNTPYDTTIPIVNTPSISEFDPYIYGVFEEWYADDLYSEKWDFSNLITGTTTLYGKWKTQFAVTFYNYDGTLITGDTQGFSNPIYVGYGESVPQEVIDTMLQFMIYKDGYEFEGWNKSTENITSDTNITSVFSSDEIFTVRFIDSITSEIMKEMTVYSGSRILQSDYPEPRLYEYYDFAGWKNMKNEIYSNTDIYALYEPKDVTVYFTDYYGNILSSETVKYGSSGATTAVEVPIIQVRLSDEHPEILSTLQFTGTFCLYSIDSGCTDSRYVIISSDNMYFNAQYNVISQEETTCNIRFYNYDSTYFETHTVLYGTIVDEDYSRSVIKTFKDEGYGRDEEIYEFYAWADAEGNEYVIGDDIRIISDISLTARYKMRAHTVQFFVQNNPEFYPQNVDLLIESLTTDVLDGTGVDRPDCNSVPERIYFETFCDGENNKWYNDISCEPNTEWKFKKDIQGSDVANPDLVFDDVKLYGKYIGKVYRLTFVSNNESEPTVLDFRYPTPTHSIDNPEFDNKIFAGWYLDNDTFKTKFKFGSTLKENTTVYAKWINENQENVIIYKAYANLMSKRQLQAVSSHYIMPERCKWDPETGDGMLVYDGRIETLTSENFADMPELQSITIPRSVISLESSTQFPVFSECENLYEINKANNPGIFDTGYYSIDGVLMRYERNGHLINDNLYEYPRNKSDKRYVLPQDVLGIDAFAFARNGKIEEIMTNGASSLSDGAFYGCNSLRDVSLKRISDISNQAFQNCINIEKITCNSSIPPSIDGEAFNNVPRTAKLIIPCQSYDLYRTADEWKEFDIQCFGTILYLDDNTTTVVTDNILTFDNVSSIYGEHIIGVEIGPNVTSIDGAFEDCSGLTSVIIPDNVVNIGENSFSNCVSLENVTIGNGVKNIDAYSFEMCSSLENIYLPYTISSIGEYSFAHCENLSFISCDRLIPPTLGQSAFDDTNNCPIRIPCESYNDYASAQVWGGYENRFDCGNVNTILHRYNNTDVEISSTTLTYNDINPWYTMQYISAEIGSVVTIIDGAFYDTQLTSVTIPNSVIEIRDDSFANTELRSINIPESVTFIGGSAFINCPATLETITVDSNNTKYDSRNGCNALIETVSNTLILGCVNSNIENSVEKIGDYAFQYCLTLTSVIIPDSVISIGENSFNMCIDLLNVYIGSGVNEIKDYAFGQCEFIDSITCMATIPPQITNTAFSDIIKDTCEVRVPSQSVSSYRSHAVWGEFTNIIGV